MNQTEESPPTEAPSPVLRSLAGILSAAARVVKKLRGATENESKTASAVTRYRHKRK